MVATVVFAAQTGCGPSCAKVIATKSPEDLNYEDAVRINDFVKRRQAAMQEAEGAGVYTVEDAKKTVTACEFAVHMLVRIRNLFEEGNPLYEQNLEEINDTRCFLDEVLISKGKLVGKGKGAFLSTGSCDDIRVRYKKFEKLFGDKGTLSERAVNDIYKKGVKAKKNEAPGAGAEGESEAAAPQEGETAEEGPGDESEGEAEGSSSMDSF